MAKKRRRKTSKKASRKKATRKARPQQRFTVCQHDGRTVMSGSAARLKRVAKVIRSAGGKTKMVNALGSRHLFAAGNVESLVKAVPAN